MRTTDQPRFQKFHLEGVRYIDPSDAYEALVNSEAVIIDVRETDELELESIPLDRVLYHPMSVIMDRLQNISKDQNIILACPVGVRSARVSNLLGRLGYSHVANLDGGLKNWRSIGLPFQSNRPVSGCGCNSPEPIKADTNSSNILAVENLSQNIDFKNLRRL